MPIEPSKKRVSVFVDGQNLYHSVKKAFGYTYPNYDVLALSGLVCERQGWELDEVNFYTGVPDQSDDPNWNAFWIAKLANMGRQGVRVFSRSLRYRNKVVNLPGGGQYTYLDGDEKGIDVRIALDMIRKAHQGLYDVAVIFSQDQDLSEAAKEIRQISREQDRWIKVACAYPISPTTPRRRGIDSTDWIQIDRATYDSCIDPRDYRKKS